MKTNPPSWRECGKIALPAVNKMLAVLTIALVFGFQTSSNLAGAYGVALSTLMALTTVMFYVMSREVWGWSFLKAATVAGGLLLLGLNLLAWHGPQSSPRGGGPPAKATLSDFSTRTPETGRGNF